MQQSDFKPDAAATLREDPAKVRVSMDLRDVTFGYAPDEPVVRDFSAQLHAGRLCCLIGPNAAGKSTLLKILLGQLTPQKGSITLGQQPLSALSPRRRAQRISYVPQQGGVGFAFTVRQVVEMGRFATGDDAAAVDAALEACDLIRLQQRIFAQLSGGQQQRVLIARAMAQSVGAGQVMLLDEPGSNLDLWHVHRLMQLLRQQAARGLAVLVVLHDLNLAARYADDVWLMDDGRLVASGNWQQVLQPSVLQPIYRMALTPLKVEKEGRPVFWVEPADTLKSS